MSIFGPMWDWSIAVDREMENDPHWIETDEGRVSLEIIRRENERLQTILDSRKP